MTSVQSHLERHLQKKIANQDWLFDCMEGKSKAFPYRPVEGGKATISCPIFPQTPSDMQINPRDGEILYMVNSPMGRLPNEKGDDYAKVMRYHHKLSTESFSTSSSASSRMAKTRIFSVLAVNQMRSIDPALNRTFREYIRGLPKITKIASRTFGFFWNPKWAPTRKGVFSLPKSFLLLKALSKKQAGNVRKKYEQPKSLHPHLLSQIPFQRIRDTLKAIGLTRDAMRRMESKAPQSPIYYVVLDSDFVSLRGAAMGAFSHLQSILTRHRLPSIASPGYRLGSSDLPLLQLGVKMDMAVRATMPMPYFPEPCTAFKVRNPGKKNFLQKFSFLGAGTLETRRFIESAPHLLADGVVFEDTGAVVTATPGRMITLKARKFTTLSDKQIKQKQCLQALRNVSQSHAVCKQWADIFYAGIKFSCSRVTDATTPMMHIFGVYDPISRMYSKQSKYSAKAFASVMREYQTSLQSTQKAVIKAARAKLYQLGMKKEIIDCVESSAKKAGQAIYRVLQEATAYTN